MSLDHGSAEADGAMTSPMASHRSIAAADERTPLLATGSAYPVGGTEEEPALLSRAVTGGKDVDTPSHHVAKAGVTSTHTTTDQNTLRPSEDEGVDDDKPLPKLQIFLLCYARVVEPIAFFSIFPFVNQMIEETGGLSKKDVGFYTGIIVCRLLFSPPLDLPFPSRIWTDMVLHLRRHHQIPLLQQGKALF